MAKVLIILSAASVLPLPNGETLPVGFSAKEFILPYQIFLEHGLEVDVATPRGKPATMDVASLNPRYHGHDEGRVLNLIEQLAEIEGWQSPLSLDRLALTTANYECVFFPDGSAQLDDLFQSPQVGNMIKRTLASDGLVGAVGYGQAALLAAQHADKWLFSGYKMTCFSVDESTQNGMEGRFLGNLQDRLQAAGGLLSYGPSGGEHVVVDRQLYTGQNQASVGKLAWELARRLKKLSALDKASCGTPCD